MFGKSISVSKRNFYSVGTENFRKFLAKFYCKQIQLFLSQPDFNYAKYKLIRFKYIAYIGDLLVMAK